MKLNKLLSEKKTTILEKWFDMIVETYPPETSDFLKNQKDRFANPVGSTIFSGIENLFEQLLNSRNADVSAQAEKISPFLDSIIRIRAIQDFTPSQAIAFIFFLKKVIREELNTVLEEVASGELLALESKIDNLALLSFDIFMKCREKLYEIKADEVRNMTLRLLQKANLICDPEFNSGKDQGSDIKEGNSG